MDILAPINICLLIGVSSMATQEQEHSAALEEVIRQYQELGRLLPAQQAAVDAAATGIPNFTTGISVAGKAAQGLGKAFTEAMSAMYNGEKGLKAFDKSIDATADALMVLTGALALLGGPITLLAAGLTATVAAGAKYVKAANEQSDKLFEAYRGMAQAGAAAQDGLQGLYNDVKRLGSGIGDLGDFVNMVAASAQDLASFRGTVFDGRREFARLSHSMKPYRLGLEQAGISQKEQNEGMLSYIRLQSRLGMTQNLTVGQLTQSVKKYIVEQDALTKLTGMTRKEQEDARTAARQRETFQATLLELRNRGDERSAQAAKNLENTFLVLNQHSKELGDGFLDETLRTESAQKLFRATAGESLRIQQELKAGMITDVQALDRFRKALGTTVDVFGVTQGRLGNFNAFAGDLPGAISFVAAGARGFEKSLAKITKTQTEQGIFGDQALDKEVQTQAKLRLTQVDAMQNMQDFVRRGVTPATKATEFFGRVVEKVTKMFKGSDSLAKEFDAEKLVQQREERLSKAYEELADAQAANEIAEESNNEQEKIAARENLRAAKEKFAAAVTERNAAAAELAKIKEPKQKSAPAPAGYDYDTAATNMQGTAPSETGRPPGEPGKAAPKSMTATDLKVEALRIERERLENALDAARTERERLEKEKGRSAEETRQARIDEAKTRRSVEIARATEQTQRIAAGRQQLMPAPAVAKPATAATPAAPAAAPATAAPQTSASSTSAPAAAAAAGVSKSPPLTGPTPPDSKTGSKDKAEVTPNLDVRIGNTIRKGGTVSWRTQNPGNISYAEITKKHGALLPFINPNGDKQQRTVGIAVMPTLEAGENAQMELWRRPFYNNRSIASAVKMWVEGKEFQDGEQPKNYAIDLAKAAGVDVFSLVKDLDDLQLRSLVQKQKHWEGYRPGTVDLQARDGGVFSGPKSGYNVTLHGKEAVIPLKNGSVPITMPRDYIDSMNKVRVLAEELTSTVVATANNAQTVTANMTKPVDAVSNSEMLTALRNMIDEMRIQGEASCRIMENIVRAQNNVASISQKILQTSQ